MTDMTRFGCVDALFPDGEFAVPGSGVSGLEILAQAFIFAGAAKRGQAVRSPRRPRCRSMAGTRKAASIVATAITSTPQKVT